MFLLTTARHRPSYFPLPAYDTPVGLHFPIFFNSSTFTHVILAKLDLFFNRKSQGVNIDHVSLLTYTPVGVGLHFPHFQQLAFYYYIIGFIDDPICSGSTWLEMIYCWRCLCWRATHLQMQLVVSEVMIFEIDKSARLLAKG